MSESRSKLAFDAAAARLCYGQAVLADAQNADDAELARNAARFIEEYGKLIADTLATNPDK